MNGPSPTQLPPGAGSPDPTALPSQGEASTSSTVRPLTRPSGRNAPRRPPATGPAVPSAPRIITGRDDLPSIHDRRHQDDQTLDAGPDGQAPREARPDPPAAAPPHLTEPVIHWTATSAAAPLGGPGVAIDWRLVAALRAQASTRLSEATSASGLDREAQEEFGRSIINDLLTAADTDSVTAGRTAWTLPEQRALAEATFNALFRLGRLQPLVDDDRVENIVITGADTVFVELSDGTLVKVDPVADSNEELIEFLAFVASRSDSPRPFSPTQPSLHLRLDGGARLAATSWVMPRPSVVIRRHRLRKVTLWDLAARGELSPTMVTFLSAAVKARKSIVVCGIQGAGKTTLLRALCAEIDPWETVGTFETERELFLDEMPEQHRIVHAWEARPGSGEYAADGTQAGAYTLDEALYDSFRYNLARQIVGEVRGREIWPMIKAMESGPGSMSTTHASDADAAIRKLVTCAMEAGRHVTYELATAKLAETIDLVVHIDMDTTPAPDQPDPSRPTVWRRERRITQVLAITPGEHPKGYATTTVFAAGREGLAKPGTLPDELRDLARYGFALKDYLDEVDTRGHR